MADRSPDVQPLLLEPVQRRLVDLGQDALWRVPVGYVAVDDLEVTSVQARVSPPDQGQQRVALRSSSTMSGLKCSSWGRRAISYAGSNARFNG